MEPAVKKEINRHCVETAISATKRVSDFRLREVDSVVERYLELLPRELKDRKLRDTLSN